MQLTIDLHTAEAITRAFVAAPQIVLQELEAATGSAVAYLKREAADLTPAAAGSLRQAWIEGVSVEGDAVIGTLTNPMSYALAVELGSRPHFPPVDAIQNWVELKLGLAGDEAEAAALAIARRIASRGTLAVGMAHRALAQGRDTIAQEYRDAAARIVERMKAAGA